MDLKEIKELIEFLENKDFVEIEYENMGVRLKLRRAEAEARGAHLARVEPDGEKPCPQPQELPSETLDEDRLATIDAPIVGTFYRAPSPEADPFVEEGEVVEKGQVLCIIEAMKIMNEIESEVRGRVKSILVGNAQPVGYADPLFVIEVL